MRKVVFGVLAFLAVFAVLRKFAPTVGQRAMEKCQEMMSGARQERGFEEGRQEPASSIAR